MSAIEVLKKEKELYLKKILDIEEGNQARPDDIVEMYNKTIKVYSEFIDAIDEALLALEQKSNNVVTCVCDVCDAETVACLSLCPTCNNRKQGALEELARIRNYIDTIENFNWEHKIIINRTIIKRIKELEEGVEK